jgi:hypothetical protein
MVVLKQGLILENLDAQNGTSLYVNMGLLNNL